MSGTFSGLEMARRAMDYFRQGIETAGHNISNANVKGYSRQTVIASPTDPYAEPGLTSPNSPGQIGTGVGIDAITRMQDEFLDFQFRQESVEGGYWEAMSQTMDYLEMFVGEPSSAGLSDSMNSFWSSMQEFQKNPDSTAARQNFLQQTDNMITQIGQINTNFCEYRDALNQQVELKVNTANDTLERIAALNIQITKIQAVGNNPNDLMDERDLLVEELSRLVNVTVSTPLDPDDGEFKIDLNGKMLVQGDQVHHLTLVPQAGNSGYYDVQVEGNTFETVTHPEVVEAVVERGADEAIHTVEVNRTASETRWAIGDDAGTVGAESSSVALALEGAFTLQVGSCGVKCVSEEFTGGTLLKTPGAGEPTEYSIRISAGSGDTGEGVIDIKWEEDTATPANSKWVITSGSEGTPFDAGSTLDLDDLASFINNTSPDYGLPVNAAVSNGRLTLENDDHSLVSVMDLKGNLGETLGYTNDNPIVTIDVDEDDSLQTIANKINCTYDSYEGAPDSPDEWVHATVEEAHDGTFYLKIESNQVGEAYRINIGIVEGASSLVAEKLGLTDTTDGKIQVLQNAWDTQLLVDGMEYLSTTNTFTEARLVSSYNGYEADTPQEVLKGIGFSVNAKGISSLRIERQVQGGYIEGLLESRDDVILDLTDTFNNFARTLASEVNAIHYAGYGTGDNADVTGTALFTPLDTLSDAANELSLNREVLQDLSLLGGASDDGTGHSTGSGDGTNVLKLINLRSSPIFEGNSTTLDDYYSSFIADLGSKSSQSQVMNKNQETLLNQISAQIQSVSGVNTDEEMLDMVQYQQSYSAIARYVTVLDEMMDTIIHGMGVVGR